jgi:FkbM family methyltransferase
MEGSFAKRHDGFLREVGSVIHVGANTGQERDIYARHDLDVLWIEPIPDIYDRLRANLEAYPKQKALNALVTDEEGIEYAFNLCNNDGLSSSIFSFKGHELWPNIQMIAQIKLRSRTLGNIVAESGRSYDALVMDTQGSELLVLKGARDVLRQVYFIKTEAANFEFYQGCTTVDELTGYLREHDFKLIAQTKFAETKDGRFYCDLIFKRD